MSFLDKLKGIFGTAKDKSDAAVDKNRERIPDKAENVYDKVSDAAEKIIPGADRRATPAAQTPPATSPSFPPDQPNP